MALLAFALACADRTPGPETGNVPEPDRSTAPADVGGLALEANVAVMESFPVQLTGTLRVENPTQRTISFDVGGCPVFLRVYGSAKGEVVWDQGDGAICTMILRTVTLEPGAVESFQTAGAGDILGEDLPDGTYRVAVYLALVEGGQPEAVAGEVQLAVPR
ncbi:MAG TPA: BsuPI-related putative proteinase inhibitor [Gemmatimonadota bacterium]|nr:BsuPI-related putative proteinase inhibitor [Gemmatimonadota bacterium]